MIFCIKSKVLFSTVPGNRNLLATEAGGGGGCVGKFGICGGGGGVGVAGAVWPLEGRSSPSLSSGGTPTPLDFSWTFAAPESERRGRGRQS